MSFNSNNTATQCDIVGDPRKLQDRIKLDITEDTTQTFNRNDYVLCTDTDNNSGTTGHYYRNLSDTEITGVHTNTADGDANATDGHVDFSDDAIWIDLGDVGTIGGYPDTWLEHGVDGVPLLVTESGESMLPVVSGNVENLDTLYGHTDIISLYSGYKITFKASKKGYGISKFLILAKDGTYVPVIYGDWANTLEFHGSSANRLDNHIFFNIGNDDTLSALGYASIEEALDLMIVKVYYEVRTNFLDLAVNSDVLAEPSCVHLSGDSTGTNNPINSVDNCLINKVIITNANNTIGLKFNNLGLVNKRFEQDYGKPTTTVSINEVDVSVIEGPHVKFLDYLISNHNIAQLQFIFLELKYNDATGITADSKSFSIIDNVSTTTDENGETVLKGQKSFKLPYFIK